MGECETLRQKLDGSSVNIAMDNFFTSPTLFECLASHDIFTVGTCRPNRTSGAQKYLESLGRTTPDRGDMTFCRGAGEMAFVQWHDSQQIFLCSTIYIGEAEEDGGGINHFRPVPITLKGKGKAVRHVELEAPQMRMDYVRYMGGVDRVDQQNEVHYHDHKSYTNHWRRVFDAKIMQMLTSNFLLFRMFVELLMRELDVKIAETTDIEKLEELDGVKQELTD